MTKKKGSSKSVKLKKRKRKKLQPTAVKSGATAEPGETVVQVKKKKKIKKTKPTAGVVKIVALAQAAAAPKEHEEDEHKEQEHGLWNDHEQEHACASSDESDADDEQHDEEDHASSSSDESDDGKKAGESDEVEILHSPATTKRGQLPDKSKGRRYTTSIALPGSILANAQSPELRTYLVSQIARAATIFNVDEVIVYCEAGFVSDASQETLEGEFRGAGRSSDPNVFLARVLQYLETPQYLRKALFPVHKDLKFAGLLNPLDAEHHVKADHDVPFREGVVMQRPIRQGQGSWVNVGLKKEIQIDRTLPPGTRVTVQIIEPEGSTTRKVVKGIAVSPAVPRETKGLYWGYTIRVATQFSEIWTQSPFDGGYDLSVGASENGDDLHEDAIAVPPFKHMVIVFGGLAGLEGAIAADEDIKAGAPRELFDLYINACPAQGSRSMRTEESIPITLASMYPFIRRNVPPGE